MRFRKDAPGPHRAASCLLAACLAAAIFVPSPRLSAGDHPPSAGQAAPDPLAGIAPVKAEPITAEIIESRRKDVRKAKDLDEDTRAKVLDLYQQSLDLLKAAQSFAAKTAAEKRDAEHAPKLAEEAKVEIKRRRDEQEHAAAAAKTATPTSSSTPTAAPQPAHSVTELEAELSAASSSRDCAHPQADPVGKGSQPPLDAPQRNSRASAGDARRVRRGTETGCCPPLQG